VQIVPVADGFEYAYVMSSPRLYADVARQLVINRTEEILERVRAVSVGSDEIRFLLEEVLWANAGYRFRFGRFANDMFPNSKGKSAS
jgi:hypothetical protein